MKLDLSAIRQRLEAASNRKQIKAVFVSACDVQVLLDEVTSLEAKLAIAVEALKRADALFADDRQRTDVINEALSEIEKL